MRATQPVPVLAGERPTADPLALLAGAYRDAVLHQMAAALFDDVRPEWEAGRARGEASRREGDRLAA